VQATNRRLTQHLAHDALGQRISGSQGAESWQGDFLTSGAHSGAPNGHFPTGQHHFARRGPGTPRRAAGLMAVARPAQRRSVLLQHHLQHLQARRNGQLHQRCMGINEQVAWSYSSIRLVGLRQCARLLLHGGSSLHRVDAFGWHQSYSTTSTEPPSQIQQPKGHSQLKTEN
jgi:hypothetical protein